MTALVSLLFIAMIPIDCEITLHLVCTSSQVLFSLTGRVCTQTVLMRKVIANYISKSEVISRVHNTKIYFLYNELLVILGICARYCL